MKSTDLLSIFKRAYEENDMAAVYSDPSQPGASSVGFIDSLSAEQFVMKHVTPEGISDGYVIRRLEDVFRIDVNGMYERRLALLYKLQKQQHEDLITRSVTPGSDLFREGLIAAQEKNFVVTICIDEAEEESDLVGFVKEIHSQTVTISRVTVDGLDDGESTFFIDDIRKMNCNTTDEKIIKLLFEYQNATPK